MAESTSFLRDRLTTFETKRFGAAVLFAILPTLGFYFIFGLILLAAIGLETAIGFVFWVGLIGFTYLLYQKPPYKAQFGASVFYLAVEAFLAPFAVGALFFYATGQVAAETGAIGSVVGGAIGIIAFFITWMAAWLVGVVLYLIAGRFESD